MAIPDYETLMLPLLQILNDGKEHRAREVTDRLSDAFALSAEEREARLPSGRNNLMYNRVHWAKTYMMNAGLLESTGRGRYRITPRGTKVSGSKPACIDNEFLLQFSEFQEFKKRRHGSDETSAGSGDGERTPEETLEASYQELNDALARELLERIRKKEFKFFEQLVVDVLLAMGYGGSREDAGRVVGQPGDGGIDGTIKEDKLGLDVVYIQAKRWGGSVGREVVQAFLGSLVGRQATKGVMVTTSTFTEAAKAAVAGIDKKVVLIDGEALVRLMIEHGVGVSEVATYSVRRVDLDYFGEE